MFHENSVLKELGARISVENSSIFINGETRNTKIDAGDESLADLVFQLKFGDYKLKIDNFYKNIENKDSSNIYEQAKYLNHYLTSDLYTEIERTYKTYKDNDYMVKKLENLLNEALKEKENTEVLLKTHDIKNKDDFDDNNDRDIN